ncbi:hypothetical protein HHK36_015168 [Tetracentron sinense]|uniref:N-acetyltransferase domain-containing protein n=1 Tax=Tetracentron sinense TaxID=13715 RepID=A0A835DCI7_TETSI|nr:hypothetical protein HHK36_015168 [Tetracentron sinense]
MAATIPLSFCLDLQQQHHLSLKPRNTLSFTATSLIRPSSRLLLPRKFDRCNFSPSFASSQSSSESSSSSSSETYLNDPLRTGRFLTAEEVEKLQILEKFRYSHEFESGSLWVRVMRAEEMDTTAGLLSESFAESMLLPLQYVHLLAFLVKQYMTERIALVPHTATLIGFYRGEGGEEELAGTVEVSFDKRGANASSPTPTPPKNSPYICNMTVKKPLRRRGIGWHLLKACEELVSQMSHSREVYLHCRMIDTAPFSMYTKAGYNIVKTDSILILLILQRRKHLMCKELPVLDNQSETDISGSDEEFPS